ncbi:MAG: 2-isopropylmalate synthase, partial [Spirochaetia bacterium]|nr:2-isopropylmalate synthase [Spirochaetia bacterium]
SSEIVYQYSPESFMGTELPYALEVCEAVLDVWQPTPEKKAILNLPNTVELCGPHIYADMIEWFIRKLKRRDSVILSVHTHNDRGSAVTAAEFAVQAGADRVEGTLFGNGERTGNVDLVTLALNLFSHGVDPRLDLSNINELIETSNRLTRIPVHARHPYAGELVYTAFSGSHQDAINKGMKAYQSRAAKDPVWEVPYLPIDPADVGRTYESLIRINSQSGKGGVAHIMERDYGFLLPREMHPEFGALIQKISDETGKEILPEAIFSAFEKEYLKQTSASLKSFHVVHYRPAQDGGEVNEVEAEILEKGSVRKLKGEGNGPIDAFVKALHSDGAPAFRLTAYHQHALGSGSDSRAAAYIQIENAKGARFFGVGVDASTNLASIRAILSALNRSRAL